MRNERGGKENKNKTRGDGEREMDVEKVELASARVLVSLFLSCG